VLAGLGSGGMAAKVKIPTPCAKDGAPAWISTPVQKILRGQGCGIPPLRLRSGQALTSKSTTLGWGTLAVIWDGNRSRSKSRSTAADRSVRSTQTRRRRLAPSKQDQGPKPARGCGIPPLRLRSGQALTSKSTTLGWGTRNASSARRCLAGGLPRYCRAFRGIS
jgi:hypothetical protein